MSFTRSELNFLWRHAVSPPPGEDPRLLPGLPALGEQGVRYKEHRLQSQRARYLNPDFRLQSGRSQASHDFTSDVFPPSPHGV